MYKVVCQVCGEWFEAKANNAKYCSSKCKSIAAWKRQREYDALKKEHAHKQFADVVAERRTLKCKGCVWRSWADHKKCVMPTCLAGLGAVNDRRA